MELILETERLILRKFTVSDAEYLYTLNNDQEVIKYTGDSAFLSVTEARLFLENYQEYNRNGYGRWAVILKATDEFIGWCGLKLNEEGFVDIGFRFFQNHWDKGYATEAGNACLQYGFNSIGIDEIIGRSSKDNLASIRVLEKLKMKFWKYGSCDGIQDAVYYKITNEY